MKHSIFLVFFSLFVVSGCAFLKSAKIPEDTSEAEEDMDSYDQEEESFFKSEDSILEEQNLDEGYDDGGEFVEDEEYDEERELVEDEEYDEEREFVEDEEYDEEGEFIEYEEYDEEGEFVEYEEYDEEDFAGDSEDKPKGVVSGFFSRLFGFSDSEENEEYEEEFESEREEDEGIFISPEVVEDTPDFETEEIESELPESEDVETTEPEKKLSFIPVKKIKKRPYTRAGYLVNAVYIVRPRDTLESISQKIYNSDQTSALYAINPHFRNKSLKVGDKVYYNSPLRAGDQSELLFYYEDVQAVSSFYDISPGENIRTVASKLLGHPDSWKEIWATNPNLQSKGNVKNSIRIVYWPKDTVVARSEPPLPQEVEEDVIPDEPPTSPDIKENLTQPLPPSPEPFPSPEPLPSPEPFPKDTQSSTKAVFENLFEKLFRDKTIAFFLVGILIILILIIRLILKRRKHMDFDYTAGDIEI